MKKDSRKDEVSAEESSRTSDAQTYWNWQGDSELGKREPVQANPDQLSDELGTTPWNRKIVETPELEAAKELMAELARDDQKVFTDPELQVFRLTVVQGFTLIRAAGLMGVGISKVKRLKDAVVLKLQKLMNEKLGG
jgi:DNA-directed RNA polymerase specialized sigma24 family protein